MISTKPTPAFWLEGDNLPGCEIGATLGFPTMVLDMEHGVISAKAADHLITLGRRVGLTVYSRVAAPERVPVQTALDAGAHGVILPQIRGLAHAREASAYAKYPPLGSRGMGFGRTMAYGGIEQSFPDDENRRTVCHPMIETPSALADVEAIAALDTVDGLFIGTSDLSLTRGRGLFKGTDEDAADVVRVANAAHAAGKVWAMPAPSPAWFELAVVNRADYVTIADDLSALSAGLEAALARLGPGI